MLLSHIIVFFHFDGIFMDSSRIRIEFGSISESIRIFYFSCIIDSNDIIVDAGSIYNFHNVDATIRKSFRQILNIFIALRHFNRPTAERYK